MKERKVKCNDCKKKRRWNFGFKWRQIETEDGKIRYICGKCRGV